MFALWHCSGWKSWIEHTLCSSIIFVFAKDESVPASNSDCQQLSEDQKNYAALDEWASLQVYNAAIKIEEIGHIPKAKLPNTLGILYSPCVLIPSAIMGDHKRTLAEFGDTPFDVVTDVKLTRTRAKQSQFAAQTETNSGVTLNQENCLRQETAADQINEVLQSNSILNGLDTSSNMSPSHNASNDSNSEIDPTSDDVDSVSTSGDSDTDCDLNKLCNEMGNMKCSVSGETLFSNQSWKEVKNLLKSIEKSYFSDPPGLQLYFEIGVERATGLMLYHCIRGTNSVEGGVYQKIRRKFGAFNASPRFGDSLLVGFRIRHNLVVGTLNRTGKKYFGHYDIWTVNKIQKLFQLLPMIDAEDSYAVPYGWINGLDFEVTGEASGICELGNNIKHQCHLDDYIPSDMVGKLTPHHNFLAQQLGTKFATTPVHTIEESTLFKKLMKDNNVQ
ncbi:hypothetical protein BJ742DRAFT_741239 [Cladochytrium replicatum]|nr:hypothetical protein BJ742DRAFT_741239 [Cladochytrium replicatum]